MALRGVRWASAPSAFLVLSVTPARRRVHSRNPSSCGKSSPQLGLEERDGGGGAPWEIPPPPWVGWEARC